MLFLPCSTAFLNHIFHVFCLCVKVQMGKPHARGRITGVQYLFIGPNTCGEEPSYPVSKIGLPAYSEYAIASQVACCPQPAAVACSLLHFCPEPICKRCAVVCISTFP